MPTYRAQSAVLQSVLEATKGTIIPTKTIRHVFETLKITPNDELYRPKLTIGVLVANQGGEFAVRRGVEWEVGGPVIVDQFHLYAGMCVQGVPVMTGTTPSWTWTATRNATVDPALKSRNFAYRMTDGATPSDWQMPYCMAQSLEVQGSENSPITFTLRGFGRRLVADAAFTAALTLPTMDMPAMSFSSVYIDDAWGALGTALAAQILGWKYTIETGVIPLATADGRADLDFTADELNVSNVKTSAEILLLAKAGGAWSAEKTKAEAGTIRQVTILSTISATRSLQFRGLMKYEAGSLFPDGEKDGLQTVNLKLVGATDATNFLEMVIKNGVGTLT
jgi:hypothetical protein